MAGIINVRLRFSNGEMFYVPLRSGYTLVDIRKIVDDSMGSSNYQLIVNGKELSDDPIRFEELKKTITNNTIIYVLQRLAAGCFLSDTAISLSNGTEKPINEVQIGDSLLCFTGFGDIGVTSVQEIFVHDVDEYMELRAGQISLRVTPEHPFFIGNGIFCSLQKLHTNDCIYFLTDGSLQATPIMSMKNTVAPGTRVYNLRTEEPHTYFANGIAVHNKVGADFVDLSNTSGLKRLESTKDAPRWRWAYRGLCLEGKCTTSGCEAYQRQVIINIQFGKFDLLADAADKSKCPICSRYVEPETCAFNNCMWRWWGIKQTQSGMSPEKISADWTVADNAYHRFDEDVSGTVTWRQLIIETKSN